jgi:hypothetical protein
MSKKRRAKKKRKAVPMARIIKALGILAPSTTLAHRFRLAKIIKEAGKPWPGLRRAGVR